MRVLHHRLILRPLFSDHRPHLGRQQYFVIAEKTHVILPILTPIFWLMRRGGIENSGRALLIGSLVSLSMLSVLTQEWSQSLFYFVIYMWGVCGGMGKTMSRSIVQEAAPEPIAHSCSRCSRWA